MLGYLSLDIICSSKLTVFLELRSRKSVRLSEQIMSADNYPSIFSRQMKAIVYIPIRCHKRKKKLYRQISLTMPGVFNFCCALIIVKTKKILPASRHFQDHGQDDLFFGMRGKLMRHSFLCVGVPICRPWCERPVWRLCEKVSALAPPIT